MHEPYIEHLSKYDYAYLSSVCLCFILAISLYCFMIRYINLGMVGLLTVGNIPLVPFQIFCSLMELAISLLRIFCLEKVSQGLLTYREDIFTYRDFMLQFFISSFSYLFTYRDFILQIVILSLVLIGVGIAKHSKIAIFVSRLFVGVMIFRFFLICFHIFFGIFEYSEIVLRVDDLLVNILSFVGFITVFCYSTFLPDLETE